MRLSVVIPSRDRTGLLAGCLQTLAPQTPPPGGMEIVVVDDGSREPIAAALAASSAGETPVRWIRQSGGGLNAARNRGIREARGEIIAFLDDDTLVSPGWAAAVHDGFERERCDALGGRITLELGAQLPRWLTEKRLSYLSRYDLGDAPREVRGPPLPFGANFALARGVLASVGTFQAGLDRVGGSLSSNGEIELLTRVIASGGRIVYWPQAAVAHRVPAERLTKPWFRRRAFAQGVSDVRTEPPSRRPYALRISRELIRAGRALPIWARRQLERRGGFDAALWLVYCRGRIAELRSQRS
jgi:glycosyltransferase involved in cell wall biosynthesis